MITLDANTLNVAQMNTVLKQGFALYFERWGPVTSLPNYLRKLTHDVLTHIEMKIFREDGMVEVRIYPTEEVLH